MVGRAPPYNTDPKTTGGMGKRTRLPVVFWPQTRASVLAHATHQSRPVLLHGGACATIRVAPPPALFNSDPPKPLRLKIAEHQRQQKQHVHQADRNEVPPVVKKVAVVADGGVDGGSRHSAQ